MSTNHLTLDIDGMSCGSCVARVRKALERLPGIRVESVRVGRAEIVVDQSVAESAIRQAIVDAGYALERVGPSGAPARNPLPLSPSAGSTSNGCCCGGGQTHASSTSTHQRHGIGRARTGQQR